MSEKIFLSVHEAADYLGLSANTLNQWRCKGKGPVFVKLGGRRVLYRRDDLFAFTDGRKYSNTAEYHRGNCDDCTG